MNELPSPVPGNPSPPLVPDPRVVAVPGLGLSGEVSRRTLQLLARPTSTVELPGFGLPAARRAPLDPVHLARLLLARLDDLDIGELVLLGHSASCPIVAQVAAWRPQQIQALILVGPATDPRSATWPALVRRWLRTAVWEHPGQIPVLLRDYHRTGLSTMRRGMDESRRHRIGPTLSDIRCPVLVVRGRHDRIAPRDWIRAVADTTPRGQHRSLDAGAHMVPLTQPARLATAISEFLDAIPETPSRLVPQSRQATMGQRLKLRHR